MVDTPGLNNSICRSTTSKGLQGCNHNVLRSWGYVDVIPLMARPNSGESDSVRPLSSQGPSLDLDGPCGFLLIEDPLSMITMSVVIIE